MKKCMTFVLLGLLLTGLAWGSETVMLRPARPGVPSEVIPFNGDIDFPRVSDAKATADYELFYPVRVGLYGYGGTEAGDTLLLWFEPPAACSLLACYYWVWNFDSREISHNYEAFICDLPDGIDPASDYWEYHDAPAGTGGPRPIGDFFAEPTTLTIPAGDGWDTLTVTSPPDIGTDIFLAGLTFTEDSVTVIMDLHGEDPGETIVHALVTQPADPDFPGFPGWFSSWHTWQFRALVRLYENPPPRIEEVEKLSGTYSTEGREITASASDLGVPLDSSGIETAWLYYQVDEGALDSVAMTPDTTWTEGSIVYYSYSPVIPGQSVGATVTYYIGVTDPQGLTTTSDPVSYPILAGTPGNILLYAEKDAYYPYAHDPVNAVSGIVDTWDERSYGKGDESVFDFYTTGAGEKVIIWIAWQGYTLGENIACLKSFLDAGGRLCLSGQDIFAAGNLENTMMTEDDWGEWTASEGSFARDYLKVQGGYDDYYGGTDTAVILYGNPDDPISGNLEMIYEWPLYWAGYGYNYCGKFGALDAGATPIFVDGFGETMAYSYEDGYKLVVLYWPFNNLVLPDFSDADTASQNTLIRNILSYFEVGVEEDHEPFVYNLPMVSPNPLSRTTMVNFSIPKSEYVSVKVYDVTGSLVSNLIDERLTAGTHTLTINTESLAPGVYFLRMDAGTFSGTRKFVVMK